MTKIIWIVIAAAIMLYIIKAIIRNPSRQGAIGENRVSNILSSLKGNYYTINNVIIPSQRATSQIDHVVVSPYGIFVIETKNYKGWIFGAENSEKWKETFRTTGGEFFRNPIKQNWGHIYALADYLNLDKSLFKSIVVFSNKATLHVESTTPVVYMSQLKRQIMSYNQEIISQDAVEIIFERIKNANLVGTEFGNKHVQLVQKQMELHRTTLQQGKCPQCGGNLVLRNGRYGAFYGCTNYPKCKFTQNMRGQ